LPPSLYEPKGVNLEFRKYKIPNVVIKLLNSKLHF